MTFYMAILYTSYTSSDVSSLHYNLCTILYQNSSVWLYATVYNLIPLYTMLDTSAGTRIVKAGRKNYDLWIMTSPYMNSSFLPISWLVIFWPYSLTKKLYLVTGPDCWLSWCAEEDTVNQVGASIPIIISLQTNDSSLTEWSGRHCQISLLACCGWLGWGGGCRRHSVAVTISAIHNCRQIVSLYYLFFILQKHFISHNNCVET